MSLASPGCWGTLQHPLTAPRGRAFAERLAQFGHPEGEEPRRQAHATLDKVTRLCNHVLTQRLFEDLKVTARRGAAGVVPQVPLGAGQGAHPWVLS